MSERRGRGTRTGGRGRFAGRDPDAARSTARPPAQPPARPAVRPAGRATARLSQEEPAAGPREARLHGVSACLAVFAHRRDDIVRAYFSEATARRHFAPMMKWLAQQRLAYHLVTDAELERITGSTHHEGVCLLVRVAPPRDAEDWLLAHRRERRSCVLALENVGNPHNLGAILRVCAHFGIEAVLVPDGRVLASGAAVRTAEGGAEFVDVLDAPDFHRVVRSFRDAGWQLLTTSSHQGRNLYRAELPRKCLVLFGEESEGLSEAMLASGDLRVRIPGTGRVESLNVAVAAGVLVGEWYRQHPPARDAG